MFSSMANGSSFGSGMPCCQNRSLTELTLSDEERSPLRSFAQQPLAAGGVEHANAHGSEQRRRSEQQVDRASPEADQRDGGQVACPLRRTAHRRAARRCSPWQAAHDSAARTICASGVRIALVWPFRLKMELRVSALRACRTWKSSAANRPQRPIFGSAALREHRLFAQ